MSKRWPSSVERARREILPLSLALYHAARDYPGGSKAIAAIYGVPHSTLQHKLSPTAEQHRLGVEDLEYVLSSTADPRILDAVCDLVPGTYWFQLEGVDECEGDDQHLVEAIAELSMRLGKLIKTIAEHRRDGIYDDVERAELRLVKRRLIGAVGRVVAQAQQFEEGAGHGR